MPYFRRAIEDRLLRASEQFPVLLVTGPRQVGKTTLVQHLREPARRYVTLDDLGLRSLAREDPELFLQRFPPPVIIDEIQYAPELLPYIKIQADSSKEAGAFWLTGSQQFHMMAGITESLAGRVAVVRLLGFSLREKEGRDLNVPPFLPTRASLTLRAQSAGASGLHHTYQNIWQGSLPAIATGQVQDHSLFFHSYVETYLQRDLRDLSQVGSLETFLRFLRACAARTGQLLNLSDLARDTDVSVGTAKNWLSILEASFQVVLLQPWHSNVTKRLYKRPKMYFLDTGLCAFLTEWTSPQALEAGAMSGAILETFAITEILKSWWHRLEFPSLYYYRDKDGREIDLLIRSDRRLYPVEIRKAATVRREWTRTFSSLDRFPEERGEGAVICLASDSLPVDATSTAVPVGWI